MIAVNSLKDANLIPGDGQKYVIAGHTELRTRAKEHQGRSCIVVTFVEPEGSGE